MRPGRIAGGLLGLLACAAVGIPLAQRLSVDWLQLQIRSNYLDEHQPFATMADAFGVPPATLAKKVGLGPLGPGETALSLAALAHRRGVPVDEAKRRIAETIIPRQFAGHSLFAGIGLVRPQPPAEH